MTLGQKVAGTFRCRAPTASPWRAVGTRGEHAEWCSAAGAGSVLATVWETVPCQSWRGQKVPFVPVAIYSERTFENMYGQVISLQWLPTSLGIKAVLVTLADRSLPAWPRHAFLLWSPAVHHPVAHRAVHTLGPDGLGLSPPRSACSPPHRSLDLCVDPLLHRSVVRIGALYTEGTNYLEALFIWLMTILLPWDLNSRQTVAMTVHQCLPAPGIMLSPLQAPIWRVVFTVGQHCDGKLWTLQPLHQYESELDLEMCS